ncbi:MAG: DUF4783 domain-containing protein [Chitinophagales bacterium]|nr:DUF4783 domain-containing protein [Chitinophagales bacterium]
MLRTNMLIAALVLFYSTSLHAQNVESFLAAVKSGSASGVAKHFEAQVELTILSQSSAYSKAQAEAVLRDFFQKKNVKGLDIKHQGTSPEGARYIMGVLQTTAGNYNLYIFGKNTGGLFIVREVRIEE